MYGLRMFSFILSASSLCSEFFAVSSLCYAHSLWFVLVSIICYPPFPFLWTLVVSHSRNHCPHTVLWFSLISSIAPVSALHLSPLSLYIDFYMYSVRSIQLYWLFVHTLFYQHCLLKRLYFFHHVFWAPLSQTSEVRIEGLLLHSVSSCVCHCVCLMLMLCSSDYYSFIIYFKGKQHKALSFMLVVWSCSK